MTVFKSIVTLDLESSGLPDFGGKPKITELACVGALVSHILEAHKVGECFPRVLQKLNLCFYPKKAIDFEASEITGLDNFLLEDIPPLDEDFCKLLLSFLQRMPSPILLIAHNGFKFDFPLLKAELASKFQVLTANILCADSLMAFRALLPISYNGDFTPITNVSRPTAPLTPPSTSCNNPVEESGKADEVTYIMNGKGDFTQEVNTHPRDIQAMNETTPKQNRSDSSLNPPPLKRRKLGSHNGNSNLNVRKSLFQGEQKLKSHKLVDIYHYLHGKEPEGGHRAEHDALALLKCIISTAPEFLSWVENNHISISKMPCMW